MFSRDINEHTATLNKTSNNKRGGGGRRERKEYGANNLFRKNKKPKKIKFSKIENEKFLRNEIFAKIFGCFRFIIYLCIVFFMGIRSYFRLLSL